MQGSSCMVNRGKYYSIDDYAVRNGIRAAIGDEG